MDGLYSLSDVQHEGGKISVVVTLDPNHAIFKGHYPGQPVLPGACMLQIVKDTLTQTLQKPVMLSKASQMKFLNMVDPRKIGQLAVNLNIAEADNMIKVSGSLIAGEKPCFKFSGSFAIA